MTYGILVSRSLDYYTPIIRSRRMAQVSFDLIYFDVYHINAQVKIDTKKSTKVDQFVADCTVHTVRVRYSPTNAF